MIRTAITAVSVFSVAAAAAAGVRVVHASPNTPEVDIFLAGSDLPSASIQNRVLKNVPYFTASDYLDVPTGTYFADVVAPSVGYAPAINADRLSIDADKDYTIVAAGDVSDGVDAFVFVDDNTINTRAARVRLIHAFENVTVDVAESRLGTIADDFEYGTASDYYELPPGSYDFSLLTSDGEATIIDIPTLSVEAGTVYTVFATGYEGIAPQIRVTVDAQHDGHSNRPASVQHASARRASSSSCHH